jgi:L-fucose isomerase-like protein
VEISLGKNIIAALKCKPSSRDHTSLSIRFVGNNKAVFLFVILLTIQPGSIFQKNQLNSSKDICFKIIASKKQQALMSSARFGFFPVASSILNVPRHEIAPDYWHQLFHAGGEVMDETRIDDDFPISFFLLTGGTEQQVLNLVEKRNIMFAGEPVLLLAHANNNSLPAALEILARLKQDGRKGKIIFLDEASNKNFLDDLEKTVKYAEIFHQLKKIKIGLIGNPSDWLIASSPKADVIKKVWGPEVVKIDLGELKNMIANVKDEEVENEHFVLTKKASEIKEPSKKEVKQAVKVYGALKKLVEKYSLNAVSVRCFDLVLDLKTTGCYALSKLNDDGIVGGCEGDLVSTLGMVWANMMTNQTVWMANPAQVNEESNSIMLAHCTVPIGMINNYKLRSHFESGLGVGIQGEFTKGKVTLLRLGGRQLDKIWITGGEIIESLDSENLCRTQVKVKLHGSAKPADLLENPLGNHILMLRGTHNKEMHYWWEMFIQQ